MTTYIKDVKRIQKEAPEVFKKIEQGKSKEGGQNTGSPLRSSAPGCPRTGERHQAYTQLCPAVMHTGYQGHLRQVRQVTPCMLPMLLNLPMIFRDRI